MDQSGNLKSGFHCPTPEMSQGYPSHPMSVPSFAMIELLSNSDETGRFLYQSRKHENSARELIKHCLRGYFGPLPSGIDLAYDSGVPFRACQARRAGRGPLNGRTRTLSKVGPAAPGPVEGHVGYWRYTGFMGPELVGYRASSYLPTSPGRQAELTVV